MRLLTVQLQDLNGRLNVFRLATVRLPYIPPECVKITGPMAVLHITYQPNTHTDNAVYEAFCDVLNSHQSMRLSKSNWAINTRRSLQKLSGKSSSAIFRLVIMS